MKWLDAIIDYGLVTGLLEPPDIDLIESCFATRGRRKGRILASMTPRDQECRYATWQAIISTVCASRTHVFSLMCLDGEAKTIFHRINDWTYQPIVAKALNAYGHAPAEFNIDNLSEYPQPDKWAAHIQVAIDAALTRSAYA
jgi:hypothetical protein